MNVLIVSTVLFFLYMIFEYWRHQRYLKSIPIRIHVNGTRGKSSVTRLIAAGLRSGGYVTVAKTTGTMPRIILPDGRESAIVRLGPANIIEQKYILRFAASFKPEVLVIECMAVNPIYQWVTERSFVKSTVSVITNSRLDHIDMMGSSLESITLCLSNTIPMNGLCFTAEEPMFHVFEGIAKTRNTVIHKIRPHDVTDEELNKFRYIEHKENLQLALDVCTYLGVPRDKALEGMFKAIPDPGALRRYIVHDRDKIITFYNLFAANDPNSTELVYKNITEKLDNTVAKIIMLNTRSDRYFRSEQLIDICVNVNVDYIILVGDSNQKLEKYAVAKGLRKDRILLLGNLPAETVYRLTFVLFPKEAVIVGVGNIADKNNYGSKVVKLFYNLSKKEVTQEAS